jgi:hypothetical protein
MAIAFVHQYLRDEAQAQGGNGGAPPGSQAAALAGRPV